MVDPKSAKKTVKKVKATCKMFVKLAPAFTGLLQYFRSRLKRNPTFISKN